MRDKAFSIAKNPEDDGYQTGLASMVYKFFDKNTSGSSIKNENILNKELATITVYRQYLWCWSCRYAINK